MQKMGITVHELILKIENDSMFVIALKKGLLPLSILSKKCYYERFKDQSKRMTNGQAVINTAIHFNVTEMTIRRAIKYMES